jgi:hypothetical protein
MVGSLYLIHNNYVTKVQPFVFITTNISLKLEVTIARKVLPHLQGIKGSMRNLMNKRLFSLYDPALPGRDVWRDDFDVLK